VPWHTQTTTPLDRRLNVLNLLHKREPEVAWQLLVRLLPQTHDVAHPTHAPRWREWKPEEQVTASHSERIRMATEIVSRLLQDVGTNGCRWHDLIEKTHGLPSELQDLVIQHLLTIDPTAFDESGRTIVLEALRSIISLYRRSPSAEWAMTVSQVDRLDEAYHRIEPDNAIQKYVWLFKARPDLPNFKGGDPQGYLDAINEARNRIVQDVYKQGGLSAILELAAAVELPGAFGWAFGRPRLLENADDVLGELSSSDKARCLLARGYVAGRFATDGWTWAEPILQREAMVWLPTQRADFLASLPSSPQTWIWAEQFGKETEQAYWGLFGPYGLSEPDSYARAAAKLIEHGYPYTAINLLGIYATQETASPDPELIVRALESASGMTPEHVDWNMLIHNVSELLDLLEESGTIEDGALPHK